MQLRSFFPLIIGSSYCEHFGVLVCRSAPVSVSRPQEEENAQKGSRRSGGWHHQFLTHKAAAHVHSPPAVT